MPRGSTEEAISGRESVPPASLSVVICGTFHRRLDQLGRAFDALGAAGCRILSPQNVDFVGERNGFVYGAHEAGELPREIEHRHLEAISSADFVWLHSPDGYVGPSASLELGLAHALGIQVFTDELPSDVTIREFATLVPSPSAAVDAIDRATPVGGLRALQRYYAKVAFERGYGNESAQECLLLITEELGELARAVRKAVGLVRHGRNDEVGDIALELADVQLYVMHLANIMDVDLAGAVRAKERVNAERALVATNVA